MNLQLNDPAIPAPGEMVAEGQSLSAHRSASPQPLSGSPLITARDPHHNRAPSLGEIHQELEAEQEAQVVSISHYPRHEQGEMKLITVIFL
jgi:hypothetical protein